jgi:leucyl aminopeptidase
VSYLSSKEAAEAANSIPLRPVSKDGFKEWQDSASPKQVRWVEDAGFDGSSGGFCAVPGEDGSLEYWLFGTSDEGPLFQLAAAAGGLPDGVYRLECGWSREHRLQASLGWGLAGYRFDRYKADQKARPRLLLDEDVDAEVQSLCAAQNLVRDLVNTPTEHMGPSELEAAVFREADRHDAEANCIRGEDLLTRNFPAIHVVGRASNRAPRLIELTWGDPEAPLLALVGKGVCFDTGGLDLKTAVGMQLMKKDMGGAAHVLALASLVMERRLPVRLQLLIPAVENAVSGNAYRPGDVIATRKGLSVEIGNTDAEGRVILSDALTYACETKPDLVIDFATLTGAARIALGADLPPLFSNDDEVARGIQAAGDEVEDPLWTMPLYQPYRKLIESPVADINNSGKNSFAGCITAALFLEHFVEPDIPWVHIDTFAWNQSNRPGRPLGGEALGLRAVFRYLQLRYG